MSSTTRQRLGNDFLRDEKILCPANRRPFTVGFSDSRRREIFSDPPAFCSTICTQFLAGARAEHGEAARGECWKLKVIQGATPPPPPPPSRWLPKIFGGSGNESWPSFQTSPSPLTGGGNTVKANNGLQPSGRHNKVNHPYQDGSGVHVFIISWVVFILLLETSHCFLHHRATFSAEQ